LPDAPDPAFAALLADPRAALRRLPPHVPLAALRTGANAFMASAVGPAVYRVEDRAVKGPGGSVAIRLYRPSAQEMLPVVLFAHGGGFLLGSLDTHDALCRSLALASGAVVIAVEYRLAPEARFPAPIDDVVAVAEVIERSGADWGLDPARLALAGDSAGAQIAAATAMALPARHLALFYPLLDPSRASASQAAFAEGYMLTGSFIDWAWEAYAGDRGDPRFDLTRADAAAFPGTTIATAAFDPLRDEGEAFGDRLQTAGVDATVRRFEGMIHGFAGMPQLTPVADEAIAWIGSRLRTALT